MICPSHDKAAAIQSGIYEYANINVQIENKRRWTMLAIWPNMIAISAQMLAIPRVMDAIATVLDVPPRVSRDFRVEVCPTCLQAERKMGR